MMIWKAFPTDIVTLYWQNSKFHIYMSWQSKTSLHLKSFIWLRAVFWCSVAIRVTSTLSRICAAWWCRLFDEDDGAIVTSQLDHVDALLRSLPLEPLHKLHLAHLQISLVLTQLLWLPRSGLSSKSCSSRVSLHRLAPLYLTQSLDTYTPSCPLKLSSASLLPTPPVFCMCICFEFSCTH